MSTALYSHTTRVTGTVLTAAIYNADHQNHITNGNPTQLGHYSDNLSQYQTVTDPGGLGTESLATSLAGELERIRFAIKRITGKAQWYIAPATDLQSVGGSLTDLTVNETVSFLGDLSPAQITSNQNNYAPSGHGDTFRFRLTEDAPRDITGLAGGTSGRVVSFHNIGSFNLNIKNDDAASTAANRFSFGSDIILFPNQSVVFQYDNTASRWKLFNNARNAFLDFQEIGVPSSPPADALRLYAKDVSGTTRLAYKDSAGAENVLAQSGASNSEIRTASATVTIPAGMTRCKVTLQGAGGGGGGNFSACCLFANGSAAGGGATLVKYLSSLTPGNNLSLTIGAKGTAGGANADGTDGGDTILASGTQSITTLTAGGGKKGLKGSAPGAGGNGGVSTNGDLNIDGGKGLYVSPTTGGIPNDIIGGTALWGNLGNSPTGYGPGGRSGQNGRDGMAIFEWDP